MSVASIDPKEKRFTRYISGEPLKPRIITVDEYMKLVASGFFHPDEKVELIEGQLINKMGIGERHAICVTRLLELLFELKSGTDFKISVQNPIRLEKSRPEPDLVLHTSESLNKGVDPRPDGIILVVEVAESTLQTDRIIKLPMYAVAGIETYWIVNLEDNQVEVYTKPSGDVYDEKKVFKPGETIKLAALDKTILVADFLS